MLICDEITQYLSHLGNQEAAIHNQRFFKTGVGEYGYGDKFLGISTPIIRKAVKKYQTANLETIVKLMQSDYHEIRLFSVLSLVERYKKADQAIQEKIYHLYLDNRQFINNWDLIDTTAPHIVGNFLLKKDKKPLHQLANSPQLWDRRIAIVATFSLIKHNDFGTTLELAKQFLNDREDLIHKATGWMLREVGKKEATILHRFLDQYYQQMPRTMLRYAIEKFDNETRQGYLRKK